MVRVIATANTVAATQKIGLRSALKSASRRKDALPESCTAPSSAPAVRKAHPPTSPAAAPDLPVRSKKQSNAVEPTVLKTNTASSTSNGAKARTANRIEWTTSAARTTLTTSPTPSAPNASSHRISSEAIPPPARTPNAHAAASPDRLPTKASTT